MNSPTNTESLIADLLGEYSSRLTASLEMLTGEPVRTLQCSSEPVGSRVDADALPWLWQAYSLSTTPASEIWTGATAMAGNAIGTKVLLAAGIEEMTARDVQGSYAEVQQGAVAALVQWIGKRLGEDLVLHPIEAIGNAPPPDHRYLLQVTVGQEQLDAMCIALPDSFCSMMQRLVPETKPLSQASAPDALPEDDKALSAEHSTDACAPPSQPRPSSLERILDFELPMTVSFGKARLPLREVLHLSTGSIIELDRGIGDPVEIIVNERIVGRGEVVVVDGNYGIRIQQIMPHAG